MGFWEHDTTFAGKKIVEFEAGGSISNPAENAFRISVGYDDPEDSGNTKLGELLQDPLADQLESLVIGPWSNEMFESPPNDFLETLVAAAPQLPSVTSLFWGDITAEDCEISWITQTDLSPLIDAFPKLQHLRIRGGENLGLGTLAHDHLQSLIIETGGLGKDVVAQVANSKLPSLEHLELYFGEENYGADTTVADATPLLSASKFPNVTYLGLRNAEYSDDLAEAVVGSDILPQLKVLDLSLGTLGQRGAEALLNASDKLGHLELLDLHHHYISNEIVAKFSELGIKVDTSDVQEADGEYRYISVGE